jgi:hypothetical protein
MIDITRLAELVPGDHGLTVVALALPDRAVHASVADAGNLNHPVTGARSPASAPRAGPQARSPQKPPTRHRRAARRLAVGRQSRDRSSWPAQATR